ncbi:RUS family member 1 [Lethenteron reissneri]|uniref:RUS family member 1 n=1 Tax=Lethenteron reissneri TaxID=7753 RepID=UPI002AB6B545|nr:RUS family member 1 [Lethenteron reissneri]
MAMEEEVEGVEGVDEVDEVEGEEGEIVASERYGSRRPERHYRRAARGAAAAWRSHGLSGGSLLYTLTSVFLPQGYPESVSEDYRTYQTWDTLQAFCSSVTGALATQAMLKGVGVGDGAASLAGATVTWLLRSGTGMLGSIVFAWKKGSNLDCDAKKWRLFADVLNDVAIFLEILAPGFPPLFTFVVCVSGVLKSVVGVAGGATRAALTVHQARRDNMADVSAKDGSQETLVNLAALVFSLMLTPLVTNNPTLTWTLFLLFTALHLFANYRAVSCVVMETLNHARLAIVARHFLAHGSVPSPAAANARESVMPGTPSASSLAVNVGVPFADVVTTASELPKDASDRKYLLRLNKARGAVSIVLHYSAGASDIIAACFHAQLLSLALLRGASVEVAAAHRDGFLQLQREVTDGDHRSSASQDFATRLFPEVLAGLQSAGWAISASLLQADEWRAQWHEGRKKAQ